MLKDRLQQQRPISPLVVSEHSDFTNYPRLPKSQRSTKLPDSPILKDRTIDINAWLRKMRRKIQQMQIIFIAYVESRLEEEADKHVAARSRQEARNPFTMAEEVFAVLFKAYGDSNRKYTATKKFRDL